MSASDFDYLTSALEDAVAEARPREFHGHVVGISGTVIRAIIPGARLGELVLLRNKNHEQGPKEEWRAEVIGFDMDAAVLSVLGELEGISASTEVISTSAAPAVPVGDGLLGRVLDSLGRPMDEAVNGPVHASTVYPLLAPPPSPLDRPIITKPLSLGLRVLDGLLTCGEGQRLGIFAAAGVGKSTLLGEIARHTDADVTVVAMIGERGREVREFLDRNLGPEGLRRSVVVVSTSDRPALERLKAAFVATAIAEYFRDQGRRVLLMMDSVTRFARAQREIGLSAGEPPTRRGFPPSVFATLPKLMERAGPAPRGSITALYAVLVEGDDMTEPVADETRSILDGHVILSRELAAANHYPAVDVLSSISRVMPQIVSKEHRQAASKFRSLLSRYKEVELLVRLGEYRKGEDAETDEAIAKIDALHAYMRQDLGKPSSFADTIARLAAAVG
jgi:type III secretion protein N (ATPase)